MVASILITRPQPAADRFEARLRACLGSKIPILVSPLMEIKQYDDALPDMSRYRGTIVTSAHAVQCLSRNTVARDIPCYCVGSATATAAREAGLQAVDGGGSASILTDWLIKTKPAAPLLYARGEHVSQDLVLDLSSAGLETDQTVVYSQHPQPLIPKAMALLEHRESVILPLFSVRSAHIFFAECPANACVSVIAISQAVAAAVPTPYVEGIVVAESPTADAMEAAVISVVGYAA